MINNKLQICKWHQCDIGYRYHHTGEEWDTHQQYSKTDIPRLTQQTEILDIQNNQIRAGAMPQGYETSGYEPKRKESEQRIKFWRALAVGMLIVTWSIIIVSVVS
jgi:hypothetical protein